MAGGGRGGAAMTPNLILPQMSFNSRRTAGRISLPLSVLGRLERRHIGAGAGVPRGFCRPAGTDKMAAERLEFISRKLKVKTISFYFYFFQ